MLCFSIAIDDWLKTSVYYRPATRRAGISGLQKRTMLCAVALCHSTSGNRMTLD
jgi:hypothetical protein